MTRTHSYHRPLITHSQYTMKHIVLLLSLLLTATSLCAQVDPDAYQRQRQAMRERYNQQRNQARQNYNDARRRAEEEYAAFRKRANAEYAAFMERAWTKMSVQPAEEKPKEPAPPKPQAPPAVDAKPETKPLPKPEVVVPPPPAPPALPTPPVREPEPTAPTMSFAVYGTDCKVHTATDGLAFKLSSVDEKGAAAAWKTLSQEKYDALLQGCLAQRDEMQLGDWGYIKLLQAATEKLLGKGSNESVILQHYLLTQSGYSSRIAKVDGRFLLLVAFNQRLFGYPCTFIGDQRFYLTSKTKANTIDIFNVGFPREQVANVSLTSLPKLKGKQLGKKNFKGERFGTMMADVGVNQSLIDYLNEFPLMLGMWEHYANAGLSDEVKADLYPMISSQIEGKSQQKAVFMILDFLQHCFEYAQDDVQFGYERPFFGDENFYYPKNDCEDRAILFSIIVRDLVGLDVVLVHWPGHLGAAVAFDEDVDGAYYTLDGRRYTVCDPTYIGAKVGMIMDFCENAEAKLIRLKK